MSIRPELLEVLARRALTEDTARPEAVERLHARGGRTAREQVAALVDPGSFVEYGRFVTAAQEDKREIDDLLDRTVADGIVGGLATIDGRACAVLSYDYLVMAGTQGMRGHRKTDRLLDVVERLALPTVFFAAGGGGRPGDTDIPLVSALDVPTFAAWARLSGKVPRIAVVEGPCFAGNAVIAGCSDLVVATPRASLGMGGPAMIAGGGLGDFTAAEVGPLDVMEANGVVDVGVDDDGALGAVGTARRLLGYFLGPEESWVAPDQGVLREAVPEGERTSYDLLPVVETLCDEDSVTVLRPGFAPELVTALGRIEGRTVGVIGNDTRHSAGAITADAGDKAARFLQLCDAYGFPVVSLVDTPGMMVGPDAERTGMVRHTSRLLVAGAQLQVPLVGVVLRRGYGLGAQAMLGGSTHQPLMTLAWPGAHLGAMGLEGAVRLSMRRELEAIEDEAEREQQVRELTAYAQAHSTALNVARHFEIDDVIDPAETRQVVAALISAAARDGRLVGSGRTVDTW
ncbi:Methylmalonyl-CoA carboxyltransferase 12S subunit [Nocardioides dokdonensis FR1436]|uniref:Methylmalonyl-CoA carboxyltransferase 12S subunit n=1 Tax=Nocardioides dokdonensis FR1436 TaxID=1300347 RepID=A0A1A9GME9_9ACTN|nr:carboxyl transferase domain-containing protein [Nocardioides dokdonensis]ANH38860.1 Methylmalonyl-CoA carboxyltransferase 12S subunit [Nocardioides dokdonensis FR1436]